MMPFFTSPTAFRLSELFQRTTDGAAAAVAVGGGDYASNQIALAPGSVSSSYGYDNITGLHSWIDTADKSTSMPLGHLALLVFEAVLEVVCVSLPGYIIAVQGMFDADAQKFVANLNVQLFTPCLIFTKLASQLTADKLVDLAIIPFIFFTQLAVSYLCSILVSKAFRFSKRPRNFVVAMGVFGNSNSLPISLVISLSKTISGLHWDRIPGDNDDEVAARGILYLLIFQQLGQLVRWSWGYHVLLAPAEKYDDEDEVLSGRIETGYKDESDSDSDSEDISQDNTVYDAQTPLLSHSQDNIKKSISSSHFESDYGSGNATPVTRKPYTESMSSSKVDRPKGSPKSLLNDDPDGHVTSFPEPHSLIREENDELGSEDDGSQNAKSPLMKWKKTTAKSVSKGRKKAFSALPKSVQKPLVKTVSTIGHVLAGLWDFMNPPLWAMLAAIIVASIPSLQRLFFSPGSFISNSVTRAISQSGGVAVPLILVILGANLARNTQPDKGPQTPEEVKTDRNLLVAAIVSRMLLPTLVMAPILALVAKYVPVSILDDPIFVIVCFLLTGAPSALQLAQICQINNVFTGVMSRLLFQSYVIWILPSTLTLVMLALRVVNWAA